MANAWFRMYAEFSGDPVIQSLAFEDQRHYIIILCLKCNGLLDREVRASVRESMILRGLGLDAITAGEAKRRLSEAGLIDEKWQPTGWKNRQFISDDSSKRVRKHRENKQTGNVSCNGSGNAPETDTEQNRTETETPAASAPKFTNDDIAMAQYISKCLADLNPGMRAPNLEKWADEIRLMRERDKRSHSEIRALWDWANNHPFWKSNILGPVKLREKWDQLTIQRGNPHAESGGHRGLSAAERVRRANPLPGDEQRERVLDGERVE